MRHFGVSKSDASLATSFSFVGYALCQLLFVKIIGKINIKRYLLIISPISTALFAAVPFCTAIWQTWIILGVEGAMLAGVFPACLLVISEYLPDSLILPANKAMGAAYALSHALNYFFSSLFIKTADWTVGFYVFPALYLLSAIFFCVALTKCERRVREKKETNETKKEHGKRVFVYLFIAGMIGLLVNMIFYAVSNWVPNLLNEAFGLSPALSVLISLSIPVTGAVGCFVCLTLSGKFGFWKTTVLLSAVSALLCAVLAGVYGSVFAVTVSLIIILLFIVRGSAHTVGFQVPVEARNIVAPASAATVINIFGCVGAAAGPPLFGALIDGSGGYTVFFIIAASLSAILAVFTVIGYKKISF